MRRKFVIVKPSTVIHRTNELNDEQLREFIQRRSQIANLRIKAIENKYGDESKYMSIQYDKVKDSQFKAKAHNIGRDELNVIPYEGILPSGKFSGAVKGLNRHALEINAKRIAYFLEGKTSTIGGIEESWDNRRKSILENKGISDKTKEFISKLSSRELSDLWKLLKKNNEYDSDTVISMMQYVGENKIEVDLLQKAMDEMKNKKLTTKQMFQEVKDHLDDIKKGNYKYNGVTEEITEDEKLEIEELLR